MNSGAGADGIVERQGVEKISQSVSIPPLKWAGGKRWFAARFRHLVPDNFNSYFEPFLGSGALYFALKPRHAVLSDLNQELINLYCVVRDQPSLLTRYMKEHQRQHCPRYFYTVRASKPRSPARLAARTLYLNRTCWNGLYRVNKYGSFNVPVGTKTAVVLETDDFTSLSSLLRSSELLSSDFEIVMDRAGLGDFVFVDPPYTVAHNNNGFIKYNEKIFSWDDQVRLAKCVERAVDRGASVLITNASHQSIHDLYSNFDKVVVTRSGVIAGKSAARGNYNEVVIKCF